MVRDQVKSGPCAPKGNVIEMSGQNTQIEEDFSVASQQLLAGKSVDDVLARYPDSAPELEPMLRLTQSVRGLSAPPLSPHALAKIEQRAQEAAKARHPALMPLPPGSGQPHVEPGAGRTRGWLQQLLAALRANPSIAALIVLAAGVLVVACLVTLGAGISPRHLPAIESYGGVITSIEPAEWLVDDDTQIFIDSVTEIHGVPAVGAQMTCIAERLPGDERFRALEIWIVAGPGTPTLPSNAPGDEGSSVTIAQLSPILR
jgi:hypothetical protein